MPGWTEQCAQHLTVVLLSIDGFEPPQLTVHSTNLLSQLIQLLLKSLTDQTGKNYVSGKLWASSNYN